jgi:predicted lysophospholipase L1 biosynthesis ABC-type transport system permease subunit
MADEDGTTPNDDWTVQVADRIESVVQTVRAKTTVPITKLAQIVVYGVLLGVAGVAAGILGVVVLVRLIDSYLPFHPHARQVWVTYVILGAIFLVFGALAMRKRPSTRR